MALGERLSYVCLLSSTEFMKLLELPLLSIAIAK